MTPLTPQFLADHTSHAWKAYHYIRKDKEGFIMRNGSRIQAGEELHENQIELCKCGLHAGLSRENAREYAPPDSVLTEVLVWGEIVISNDKLVATDRMLVREI